MNKADCKCENCVEFDKLSVYGTLSNQYSLHVGVVNLYPLMFGLIKDREILEKTLTLILDP